MAALQALFFDIDDTLCATTQFALRARRNAVRAMLAAGVEADEELVLRELVEVIAEFSSNYEHHFDKLLLRLPPSSLAHVNRALAVAAGVAAYHDTKFRELTPYPGVIELFGELRELGLRLGIITHGLTIKQAEKLVRLGLVPLLDRDSIFISDQIGIAKPNPKLYLTALRAHGLDAAATIYVGDNPVNDVAPPKSLGIVTILARLNAEPTDGERRLTESETPDFVIHSFQDLRDVLRGPFGLPLAPTGRG